LFEQATGEYITFQDADDFSESTRIEKQLLFLQKNNLEICGTNISFVNENGYLANSSNFALTSDEIKVSLLNQIYKFCPATFLFHKNVYKKIGGYHEYWDRMGAEDYYWTWLILEKYELQNIPDSLYNLRNNPNSISRDLSDNYKKLLSGRILNFLIQQRFYGKTDALHNNIEELNDYVSEIEKPYLEDSSFFYQELARRLFYQNDKSRALKMIIIAIYKNPIHFKNYRDLIYYFRKTVFL
jgi:hypothetical protein